MTQIPPVACPACRAELRVVTGPRAAARFTVCAGCAAILRRTDDGVLCRAQAEDLRGLTFRQWLQIGAAISTVLRWHEEKVRG
jgi:transposase-like protein